MEMTQAEILKKGKWITEKLFQLTVFSDLFAQEVKIVISFWSSGNSDISDKAMDSIGKFLSLEKSDAKQIEDEVWKHCLACNQTQTSKGSRDGGKTWFDTSSTLEENLARYEIYTREDAIKKYEIVNVLIQNNAETDVDYIIQVDTPWDSGHLIMFRFKNNALISVEN
jgi:hypothetical protein